MLASTAPQVALSASVCLLMGTVGMEAKSRGPKKPGSRCTYLSGAGLARKGDGPAAPHAKVSKHSVQRPESINPRNLTLQPSTAMPHPSSSRVASGLAGGSNRRSERLTRSRSGGLIPSC